MTRESQAGEMDGVPGCETGPAGRMVFVVSEIRAALRRRKQSKAAGEMTETTRSD